MRELTISVGDERGYGLYHISSLLAYRTDPFGREKKAVLPNSGISFRNGRRSVVNY